MRITLTVDGRVTLDIDTETLKAEVSNTDNIQQAISSVTSSIVLGVYKEKVKSVNKKHYITEFNPDTKLYTVYSNQFQTIRMLPAEHILANFQYLEPLNGITSLVAYRRHNRTKHCEKEGVIIGAEKPRNIIVTPENLNSLPYSTIKRSYERGLLDPDTPEFREQVLEVYKHKRNIYSKEYKRTVRKNTEVIAEKIRDVPKGYYRKQGGITPETIQLVTEGKYWKIGYKTLRKLIKENKIPESDLFTAWKCIRTQERYTRNKAKGEKYDIGVFEYCEKFYNQFRDLRTIPKPKTKKKETKEPTTSEQKPTEKQTIENPVEPKKELNFHEKKIAEKREYEKLEPLKLPDGKERQDLIEEFLRKNPDKRCKDTSNLGIVGFRVD